MSDLENGPSPNDEFDGPEDYGMGWCPKDGDRRIVRLESTGGSDPYSIEVLACGHRVIWMSGAKEDCHILERR
jgi:hypothetical protein